MAGIREMINVVLLGSSNTGNAAKPFTPSHDIPSLADKVLLITGGAGDLGREAAIQLARHGQPARIYIADLPCDAATQNALIERITTEAQAGSETTKLNLKTEICFLELDLTSFASIRACAAAFLAREQRLDLLILNAGIIRVAPGVTKDGYEVHFGLNYLGHALLARLLVPVMERTAQLGDGNNSAGPDVRLVVVSSEGHTMAPARGIQFEQLHTDCSAMSYAQRYGQSKLALISLAKQIAHRHPLIKTAAVHPGRILTGMATSLQKESLLAWITKPIAPLFCVPVAVGIINHLWAATSLDVVSGGYYEPVGMPGKESKEARDEELSARLWEWTEGELKGLEPLG